MLHIKRLPPLAKVLIPAPAACVSTPPAPVFHHATSERQGNTGETKTSLNVRRANKAGDVTGGSSWRRTLEKKNKVILRTPCWGTEPLLSDSMEETTKVHCFIFISTFTAIGFFGGFFALMIQVCSSSITGVYKKTSRAALFRQGFSIKHLVVLSITLVATKVCLVMHLIPCYRNFQNLPVKHK